MNLAMLNLSVLNHCMALTIALFAELPAKAEVLGFGDLILDKETKSHWFDGQAEICSYDLEFHRYGKVRHGTAVIIFVTETFSRKQFVKMDAPKAADSDRLTVLKMNKIYDFPTGIYDYNIMTSAFVGWERVGGRVAGSPIKISFSSQEWCGHVWTQLNFEGRRARYATHSYFQSDGDEAGDLSYPQSSIAADTLWHWARRLAAPKMNPGMQTRVAILRSATAARLSHQPLAFRPGTLSMGKASEKAAVPAGDFHAVKMSADIEGGPLYEFWVEGRFPNRIVRWQVKRTSLKESAALVACTRMPYWQLSDTRHRSQLSKIGLNPRTLRTP